MKVLYAGDSAQGGAANYLLGILKAAGAQVRHVAPGNGLGPWQLKRCYDVIILSDFSRDDTPLAAQKAIAGQVRGGTGLLMVGGWGSFAGPFGKWRGSLIEKSLPVRCLSKDDRRNVPGGLLMVPKQKHPALKGLNFSQPPVMAGLNEVRPKKGAKVILSAKTIQSTKKSGRYSLALKKDYPLLVVNQERNIRTAALATDLAPHWCGGLVDWGTRRVKIKIAKNIQIEVGDLYVRFGVSLLKWLGKC